MDASGMKEEAVERAAAAKLAIQDLMEEKHCAAGAMECRSAVTVLGAPVCMALGELSDEGLPVSCETDVNGAVTMAMLQAVTLGKEACFLADLTIRHPQNDNAELLWHCGPFPYSLKDSSSVARLVQGQERFELKKGPITVCRFDDVDGKYYLFGGEGKGVDGPETNGTYVWFETNNWKMWDHFRKKSVRSKPPFTLPQFFFPVWFVLGLNFLVLLRSFRLTMICACISLSLSPSRLKWIFA